MTNQKTKPEMTEQYEELKQKAKEKGLTVFLGILDRGRVDAEWRGGWSSFLDAAANAEARVLYLEKVRFDVENDEGRDCSNLVQIYQERELLESQRQRQRFGGRHHRTDLEQLAEDEYFNAPVLAKLTRWKKHKNEIVELRCVWFREGIAHEWRTTAKWLEEWKLEVRQAVRDVQEELEAQQQSQTEEESLEIHAKAQEMARHERYADAKSDSKREFMALQIFPEEDESTRHKIINLAVLYYWWSIEPEQTASKDERARQLHSRGESMVNIAAILDLSPAKVKRAIQSVKED